MPHLKEIGEFGFIDRISKGCLIRPDSVLKGIGDDAAAFFTESGRVTLVTTDLLVERVHFIREATSGFNLGYKTLAVNLSDIAAMGGTPCSAFVSIGIPEDYTIEYLDDVFAGMKSLASEFDVNILGGDTTRSKSDLIINIALVGSVPESEILYRHTAKIGDIIATTGCLGDSRAGLHLILGGIPPDSKPYQQLIDSHLLPKPYIREGRFLAGLGSVHAAIDVSDGLSSDLQHILDASGVGARLVSETIPLSDHLNLFCSRFNFNPIEFALAGGEDYILVCTLASDKAKETCLRYQEAFGAPLHIIGEVTRSRKMELVKPDGTEMEIRPTGWNHFKV